MKCHDAVKWTAARALDDLDVEERRELEGHLETCAACRTVAEGERRAVEVLRSAAPVESSVSRRDQAAAAMAAAHRELAERAVLAPPPSRRRWIAVSVAAALLVALAVPFLLRSQGLRVDRLDGSAWVHRVGEREPAPLREGELLRAGDSLTTSGIVRLRGPGHLSIEVNRNSEVMVDWTGGAPLLRLKAGTIYGQVRGGEVTIVGPSDGRLTVRDGTFEAKLAVVAGYPKENEKKYTLAVQMQKGSALLEGANGSRRVEEGQAATVTGPGHVEDDKPGPFAPWRKHP
jgi:ferric-dicitrate binding protein FerR (iron transport regulator)